VTRLTELTELTDSAELLVSELMTNVITANQATGIGSPVRPWLLADHARLLILVQDDSPHPPTRTTPSTDAGRGRGLLLVDAISNRWDWYIPNPQGLARWRGHS
jgi:hypothetical protein